MKKLLFVSLAFAGASIYLLTSQPSPDAETLEKAKAAETPLHIFRDGSKSVPKVVTPAVQPATKKNERWVRKESVKVRVHSDVAKQDQVIQIATERKPTQKKWQDTIVHTPIPNKPVLAHKTVKNHWVAELSGEEANFGLVKKEQKPEKCVSSDCVDEKRSINLVGVVVETERFAHKTERLVAGDFHIGDAKKLPVVYVK